jgi:RinA family phage transcriptional activator
MSEQEKHKQIEEWLRDYESIKGGIENLQLAIEDIAEEGMGVDTTKDCIQKSNSFSSVTENAAIKIYNADISRSIKTMTNIVNSIDRALNCLTDIERSVVVNRCIDRMYYYQLCGSICVSERTARRIKKEAIRKMAIVLFGK